MSPRESGPDPERALRWKNQSTVESNSTLEDTSNASIEASVLNFKFDLFKELKQLLGLAFPSVALQFNMYFIYPQAASVVGRNLGPLELSGLSLGCLVGNLTCLSVLVGVLSAADSLMPRAYSLGRFAELGRLTVRAILVCLIILIPPVIPLCTVLEPMLKFLGQDPTASRLAAQWVRVYLLGVPANLILRTLQRFLVAQSIPCPPRVRHGSSLAGGLSHFNSSLGGSYGFLGISRGYYHHTVAYAVLLVGLSACPPSIQGRIMAWPDLELLFRVNSMEQNDRVHEPKYGGSAISLGMVVLGNYLLCRWIVRHRRLLCTQYCIQYYSPKLYDPLR